MASEYLPTSSNLYALAMGLQQHYTIRGNPYSNVLVTTGHPEFSDVYDPYVMIETGAVSAYWPGGSPEDRGRNFETISWHFGEKPTSTETAADVIAIREAIANATISKDAIDRVPPDMKVVWENFKARYQAPILFAENHCAIFGLPLALCITSRVLQSETIEPSSRMMHMWYPQYISPKPVLAKIRNAVRTLIQNETIPDDSGAD